MEQDIINALQYELGRLLSPMELEIINDIRAEGFNDNQIRDAIKEAVYRGILNLKYISKILKTWKATEDVADTMAKQDLSFLD